MAQETVDLKLNYQVDTTLLLTPEELLSTYLVDIPTRGLGGGKLTHKKITTFIKTAQRMVETYIDVKIAKQVCWEQHDYDKNLFTNWGFTKVNYPINYVYSLKGKFNSVEQITWELDWVTYKKTEDSQARNLYVVPYNGGITYGGGTAIFVFFKNFEFIPNYWNVVYLTGYDKVPLDIQNVVCKLACIMILAVLGDISFGAGIASTSLSIDGLSQSINTTQSAENSLYSARIRQFWNELYKDGNEIRQLKNRYKSIALESL